MPLAHDVAHSESSTPLRVAASLRQRLGAHRMDLWFGPDVRWSISAQSEVCIEVSGQFVADCITRMFRSELAQSIEEVVGAGCGYRVIVAENSGTVATHGVESVPPRKSAPPSLYGTVRPSAMGTESVHAPSPLQTPSHTSLATTRSAISPLDSARRTPTEQAIEHVDIAPIPKDSLENQNPLPELSCADIPCENVPSPEFPAIELHQTELAIDLESDDAPPAIIESKTKSDADAFVAALQAAADAVPTPVVHEPEFSEPEVCESDTAAHFDPAVETPKSFLNSDDQANSDGPYEGVPTFQEPIVGPQIYSPPEEMADGLEAATSTASTLAFVAPEAVPIAPVVPQQTSLFAQFANAVAAAQAANQAAAAVGLPTAAGLESLSGGVSGTISSQYVGQTQPTIIPMANATGSTAAGAVASGAKGGGLNAPSGTQQLPTPQQAGARSDQTPSGAATGRPSVNGTRSNTPARQEAMSAVERLAELRREHERRWDDFIQGDHNRLAYTAATMVLEKPGQITPLFIHGPHGSGKSHLAIGIAHKLRSVYKMRRVLVLTGEQFTIEFTESARGGGFANFRRKYRDVDCLVIDDLQFCLGKAATLAELRNTIDMLLRDRRQVILVADRSLNELSGLTADLHARLAGGMTCGIEPLDLETRVRLLEQLCKQQSVVLPIASIRELAGQSAGDARVLQGLVHRLVAQQRMGGGELSHEQAIRCTLDLLRASQPVVRMNDIERVVCETFGLDDKALRGKTKAQTVSQPRMLAMFLARKYTRSALSEIGDYFGKRQHSTVISAHKKVELWLNEDELIQCGRGRLSVKEILRNLESTLRVG